MSKSDLWLAFVKVVSALNTISPEVIVWPNRENRQQTVQSFQNVAGLRGVVGDVHGTYIRIKTPQVYPQSYTCRKFYSAITLQGISNNNLYFLDCFTGYPGSVADIRIFRQSDIYNELTNDRQLFLDDDQFIIGDKAYPLEPWCITPWVANRVSTPREINFNTAHARTRTAIERAWALFFGRFRRMQYLDMSRIDLIPSTIIACCVLQNICRMDPNSLIELFEQEGQIFMGADNPDNQNDRHEDDVAPYVANETGESRRERLANEVMDL
ncbi:putative nuclease HARBI1 [Aphidius gifuensis]|uniref:putative nuclease HARBI1 n=1 Tax=Aphidius gifuensis TaxID=684658 RepID=UPI001CDBB396|nr:putative nuclease HARBI1 [Aphidius gifuensis]